MGGNVKFGVQEAHKIDLTNITREKVTSQIFALMCLINDNFSQYGKFEKLWTDDALFGMHIFSGSSEHLFNAWINTDKLVSAKRCFGDIDVQCPNYRYQNFNAWIHNHFLNHFFNFDLLGYKCSSGQIITLWYFKDLSINIQIDFEFVEFNNYRPSEFSKFSHSSPWNDLELGIKGVFHKLALRALCARDLKERRVRENKEVTDKMTTLYAFSVNNGLRRKYDSCVSQNGNAVFREIEKKHRKYITEIEQIFIVFFDGVNEFNMLNLKKFESFSGLCELVDKYWSSEDALKFTNGFQDLLWGQHAQKLSKDLDEDIKIKKIACEYMSKKMFSTHYDKERYEHS